MSLEKDITQIKEDMFKPASSKDIKTRQDKFFQKEYYVGHIPDRATLKKLALKLGVRDDWHEPDEEGLTVKITGKQFDNAGFDTEYIVHLFKDGKEVGEINLATLFAYACGTTE